MADQATFRQVALRPAVSRSVSRGVGLVEQGTLTRHVRKMVSTRGIVHLTPE